MVKAPDYGHRATDKQLAALSKRLQLVYRQAMFSLREKTLNYLEQFEKEDAEKRALYDSGELEHEAFIKWRKEQLMLPEQWNRMLNQLSADLTNRNEVAASMINDELPEVYALNHNYGTYEAETGSGIDTTYTMYDKATVARLVKEKQVLLPEPKVNIPKDQRWNKQHIQSAVLQGILQGESMSGIADRLASVTTMSANAAIRNARTAVTGAENAGRIDSYKRAQSLGIRMKQVWMATLDDRTRDSHAEIDGEKVEVGERFSNGCRYPGDPKGLPEEVYNCRCTLVAEVEGSDQYNPAARPSRYLQDAGLTYEQWKNRHIRKSSSQSTKSTEAKQIQTAFINAANKAEKIRAEEDFHISTNEPQKLLPIWNPYQEAKEGGANAKLLIRAETMTDKEIRSSIKSLQKRIEEHLQKISRLEERLKNGGEVINRRATESLSIYWANEIVKYTAQRDVFRGIINDRGENE